MKKTIPILWKCFVDETITAVTVVQHMSLIGDHAIGSRFYYDEISDNLLDTLYDAHQMALISLQQIVAPYGYSVIEDDE